MQHGEEDVKNGISMMLSHIHSHWRPSWYEFAGGLRPNEAPLLEVLGFPSAPLAIAAVDGHSRSPSPDVMEVEDKLVNIVSIIIHAPLMKPPLSDIQCSSIATPQGARSEERGVTLPSLTLSHRSCVEDNVAIPTTGPPLAASRETLSPLQVQVHFPGPVEPEGPMTRSRRRDENVNQSADTATTKVLAGGQSAILGTKVGGKRKEAPITRQPPRMTTRRVAPRQPSRTRPALVAVQGRKQPERNTRKKVVQDTIPHIKGMVLLCVSLSICLRHLTLIN